MTTEASPCERLEAALETKEGKATKVNVVEHSGVAGTLWFAGWLFTVGYVELDRDRVRFFARVKAEPVPFLRPPPWGEEDVSLSVRGYRQLLYSEMNAVTIVRRDDGELAGQRARLLIFDRVGAGTEPPSGAVHLDLRALASRLHFDRLKVLRLTATHIAAELHYGDRWVPTRLRTNGPHVELDCEGTSKQRQS